LPKPSLFSRLKDRKLVQWGVAYLAAAWVLVEATGHVIDQFAWPVGISQVVTILAFFGFFVVLVVAWYHGEKGRQWVSGPELLIIALLLLISGGVLSMLRRPPGPEGPSPTESASAPESHSNPSIAVLPFENLSPNPEDAFFAGGLQDELLTQLSKVEALKVISRTSVREYATVNKPLREIAEELGVTSLVEGSVQVLGDRLRVNVQLIDAFTDEHLWADRFDRDLDDAFAVQFAGKLYPLDQSVCGFKSRDDTFQFAEEPEGLQSLDAARSGRNRIAESFQHFPARVNQDFFIVHKKDSLAPREG